MLGRLLYRTLPDQFSPDSTYAWFPLMTPTAMDKILTRLGQKQVYSLKKPTPLAEPMVISGYEDVRAVLRDEKCFGNSFRVRRNEGHRGTTLTQVYRLSKTTKSSTCSTALVNAI